MTKNPPLSPSQALSEYYGGLKELQGQMFPFTCLKCGGKNYPVKDKVTKIELKLGVMGIADCYKHIRRIHKERIK